MSAFQAVNSLHAMSRSASVALLLWSKGLIDGNSGLAGHAARQRDRVPVMQLHVAELGSEVPVLHRERRGAIEAV